MVRDTYDDPAERWQVRLVVSYGEAEASSPAEAIAAAVGLITDMGSADTVWTVTDRQAEMTHYVEQGDALGEWPSGDIAVRIEER